MRFPFVLPENKEFDAVGFGTNAVDYLIEVPEYPKFNSKIELSGYIQAAGGEVATTMVGLQRLGLKTVYAGRFGTDKEGDYGIETLRQEAVDIRFAEQIAGAKTQIAFILIDEKSGERTVIWHRDRLLSYAQTEAPLEAARLGRVLHFSPHDARACLVLAREAKSSGAIVSADVDNVFEGILELLPLIDVLLVSSEFPAKIVGASGEKQSLLEIKQRFGCAVVGMTLGASGSLVLCENRFIESAGFAVPGGAKDTTGAGDAFRAGFLYGLLKNETIEIAAQMANAVAALKCRALGARTALPNEKELLEFIKK